jgi:hypothetical protein
MKRIYQISLLIRQTQQLQNSKLTTLSEDLNLLHNNIEQYQIIS